jgi:hypothetical protein
MNRASERRKTAKLSESLRRKLDMYGLAAAAAGIGMAALSSSAQAEIVYTPAHQEIGRHGIGLDLNNDGFADFRIQERVFRSDAGMVVYSLGSNRVLATAGSFVANLAAGYHVGPNNNFRRGGSFSSFGVPASFFTTVPSVPALLLALAPGTKARRAATSGSSFRSGESFTTAGRG